MKIAITADDVDTNSTVPEKFANARWLLIVDMDQYIICESIEKCEDDPENEKFARVIVNRDCESVICGEIEKTPFEILAERQITRSYGSGLTVMDALNCEGMLPFITDYANGSGCGSSHSKNTDKHKHSN